MRQKWKRLLAGLLILVFGITGCAGEETGKGFQETAQAAEGGQRGELTVTYLDVGQGNGILAESQGHFMLIDGGDRESSSFTVSFLKKQGIEKLDYILISHYDEDHLAGAVGAIHSIPAKEIIAPDYETDSAIYRSYEEAVEEKGYDPIHPQLGEEFQLGAATFRIISPTAYGHEDENQDSVGIILQNGENKFFIGGDIGLEGEKEILESGISIQADVCLMNHHGSHVSREFYQAVSPSSAVISCGAGNSYGHPRQDTVELIQSFQTPLYRTDLQGTITAKSDGRKITFDQEPCNDYTPGDREGQEEEPKESVNNSDPLSCDYILNTHTKKIHRKDCSSVESMDEDNKAYYKGDKQELLDQGYADCKSCRP